MRDSVERCRTPGASAREVLDAWFAFGEDVEVLEAGEDAWRSGTELSDFADRPASAEDRDWRALDPRRDAADEDDEHMTVKVRFAPFSHRVCCMSAIPAPR